MVHAMPTRMRLFASALYLLQFAVAQQCYYPNGANSNEKACSKDVGGSACCPDKWECLDNGLCHYPPDDLYGRYSCTDKTWKSSACPSQLCTDVSQVGAEAVTQCSDHDNQWCCDADRVNVDCCKGKPAARPFFNLAKGKQYAIIGSSTADTAPSLASITGLASGASASASAAASSAAASSASSAQSSFRRGSASPSASPSATPITSLRVSVSSGSAGPVTIIQTVVTEIPASTGTSSPASASTKSNTGLIVGCAIGIPLFLIFLAIAIWLLRRRSQQRKSQNPYKNGSASPDAYPEGAAFASDTKPAAGSKFWRSSAPAMPDMAELPSQSVGPGRPVSALPGKAELESGAGFAPGAAPAHAPHLVGVGGGNGHTPAHSSWSSPPPGYEAAPGPAQGGTGATTSHPPQAYMAYRPPAAHAGAGTDERAADMAELSAVRTPPA